MSPAPSRFSLADMNVYTALLGVATLVLLVAVIWVAMSNIDQTSTGGGGGSMFGSVSTR